MKEEKNPLDPQTVFSAKNSEIAQTAVTQCVNHKWEKLSDSELYCPVCKSGALINPENIKKYVS